MLLESLGRDKRIDERLLMGKASFEELWDYQAKVVATGLEKAGTERYTPG